MGYIGPLLEYGDVVWGPSLTCDQDKPLEKVQIRAGKNYNSYIDVI